MKVNKLIMVSLCIFAFISCNSKYDLTGKWINTENKCEMKLVFIDNTEVFLSGFFDDCCNNTLYKARWDKTNNKIEVEAEKNIYSYYVTFFGKNEMVIADEKGCLYEFHKDYSPNK